MFKHLFVLLSFLLLVACDSPQITVYKAPRSTPAMPGMMAQSAPASAPSPENVQEASAPQQQDLNWIIPPQWIPKPPSPMRLANFEAKTKSGAVDVSVTKLEGNAGGIYANINRWRGQVGLAPASEGDIDRTLERKVQGELQIITTSLKGESTQMLVAIIELHGFSWFFKAMGPTNAVQEVTPQFNTFIQGIQHAH